MRHGFDFDGVVMYVGEGAHLDQVVVEGLMCDDLMAPDVFNFIALPALVEPFFQNRSDVFKDLFYLFGDCFFCVIHILSL